MVALRFRFRLEEDSWWRPNTGDLVDALDTALDVAHLGGVDDIEEEREEMCVYLIGRKPQGFVDVARQALARFAVPAGGYPLLPAASTKGGGASLSKPHSSRDAAHVSG